MSKFGRITGARPPETVWFSRACNALAGQTCHIRRTQKNALKASGKAPVRGVNPALRAFSSLSAHFQRHFDPVYGAGT